MLFRSSSTPRTFAPSNRTGSSIRTRLPSARTALFAVSHATRAPRRSARQSGGRPRCPSSAHRSPRREPGPWLRRLGGVLAPHVSAADAPVATDRDQQRGGPPPERLVRQSSGHRVARDALASAASTPLIGLEDSASKHGPVGLQPLAGHHESELVKAAEGGQVSAGRTQHRDPSRR